MDILLELDRRRRWAELSRRFPALERSQAAPEPTREAPETVDGDRRPSSSGAGVYQHANHRRQAVRLAPDRTKRDALVRAAQAMSGSGSPLIPIADFFDGNGDMASIAPNLITHPDIPEFRDVFRRIEQRPNVASVWAHLDLEWEAYPGDDWPFASQVFVITTAGPGDVDDWVAELDDDPCFTAEASEIKSIGAIPTGYRVVSVWWD